MFRFFRYWLKMLGLLYFPIFLSAALTIYAMQIGEIPLPFWINSYTNDFLCMPLVLYICREVIRFLKSETELQLPLGPILMLTLFYAFYFEFYLPNVNPRYTQDFFDVLLYFMGSGFFYAMQYIALNKKF